MLPILLSLALLGSGVSEDNMEVSQSAIKILKELEKLRLEAYRDGSSISIGLRYTRRFKSTLSAGIASKLTTTDVIEATSTWLSAYIGKAIPSGFPGMI